jgi:DNA-binding transcriptional regulator YhcF (GntR family)
MEFKNGKSIAMQIADNLSERILNGALSVDSKIPSVRELAAEMGVNPNTIVRSYAELQSKHIIANSRGIGYFVSKNAKEIIHDWRRQEFFESELPEFVRQMSVLGINYEDLKEPVTTHLKELEK